MSFSFAFAGDDIEGNEDDYGSSVNPAATECSEESSFLPPRRHTLEDLLIALPSQLSYNHLIINPRLSGDGPSADRDHILRIQRRSLFDIRAQLMAEANPEENNNDVLLAGLEAGDLSSGIYEGGFKTWECAVDLASLVSKLHFRGDWHIIELGAGSAVPSLAIMKSVLKHFPDEPEAHLHFTLCDYNEDVLRLATAPNVFLNYYSFVQDPAATTKSGDDDLDLEEIGPGITSQVSEHLKSKGLSVDFISGAWGSDFVQLVRQQPFLAEPNVLILASETIYSPDSTRVFSDTVMSLLDQSRGSAKAWVGAKKVYFGVGGGVEDFAKEIYHRGGKMEKLVETATTGVGRVIVEVTKAASV